MHLLIDVRTSSLSDIPIVHYAQLWAESWLLYHPDDRITFLWFENDPIEKHDCIFIKRGWNIFQKKLSAHNFWPDRIISFSKLSPIDKSIPTVAFVDNLTDKLYPHLYTWYWKEKENERMFKKLLKHSRSIIVPNSEVRSILWELYNINEDSIAPIPYLEAQDGEFYKNQTFIPYGIFGDYYITEWTPWDEWNPTGLIESYAYYVKENINPRQLIIIGDLWWNLTTISHLIGSLGIIGKVKIVWVLSKNERSLVYAHAKWWIYVGYHYSRWPSISLANSYKIPLYISDIPDFDNYHGSRMSINQLDALNEILINEPSKIRWISTSNNKEIIQAYTRIIAEWNLQKS